jgi:hypothetical protein
MLVWIFEVASGCLAIASMARPPINPIPIPAPITANPAPIAPIFTQFKLNNKKS